MAFQAANANPAYIQHTVAGGDPNADPLLAPANFPSGTLLLDQTLGVLWILRRSAGVAAWVSTAASSSPPSGPAGGDLGGTYPNPTVVGLHMTGQARGDVLYFDGTNWVVLHAGTNGQLLRTNGAGADPAWSTVTGLPAGVQGDVLYYDGANWVVLAPGVSGNFLQTAGAGANPSWAAVSGTLPAGVQGDILYNNGANWVVLAPALSGRFLQTQGPGANPQWADIPGVLSDTTVTTDATPTQFGAVPIVIGSAYTVMAQVTGIQKSGGVENVASYVRVASFHNLGAGAVQVGTTSNLVTIESDATWDCDWIATGGAAAVNVTGVAATTIDWSVTVTIVSAS